MDYGSYLKATTANPSRKSKHHTKQTTFKGSNREMRGKILRFLLQKSVTLKNLSQEFITYPSGQLMKNLTDLEKEGFIRKEKGRYKIIYNT